jgi:ParB-like nuclease domain
MNSDCELMDDENEQPKEEVKGEEEEGEKEEEELKEEKKEEEVKEEEEEGVKEVKKESKKRDEEKKYIYLPPNKLKVHDDNKNIYNKVTGEDVKDLLEEILHLGQLEDIIIDQDYKIISGARRRMAVQKNNESERKKQKADPSYIPNILECRCVIENFTDDERKEKIIGYNIKRKKTFEQIYNEIEILEPIFKKRTRARQLSGLKQFASVTPNLEERKGDEQKISLITNEMLADVVHLSKNTIDCYKKIGKRNKEKDEAGIKAVKKYKSGWGISSAYYYMELMDAAADRNAVVPNATQRDKDIAAKAGELVKKIDSDAIGASKANEAFKKYVKEYDNKSQKQAAEEGDTEQTTT